MLSPVLPCGNGCSDLGGPSLPRIGARCYPLLMNRASPFGTRVDLCGCVGAARLLWPAACAEGLRSGWVQGGGGGRCLSVLPVTVGQFSSHESVVEAQDIPWLPLVRFSLIRIRSDTSGLEVR